MNAKANLEVLRKFIKDIRSSSDCNIENPVFSKFINLHLPSSHSEKIEYLIKERLLFIQIISAYQTECNVVLR